MKVEGSSHVHVLRSSILPALNAKVMLACHGFPIYSIGTIRIASTMFAAGPPVEAAHGFAALDGALPPHDQARGRGGGGGGSASHHAGRAAPGERRH